MQLTVSDQRQTAPAWSPDGKWIAYQSDYDGDEQWDIFLVSPKTGKVVNLTQTREIAETESDVVARRPLSGIRGKTKNIGGLRDRHLRHGDARGKAPHHRTRRRTRSNSNPIWSKDGSISSTRRSRPRARIRISSSPTLRRERARCLRRMKASRRYFGQRYFARRQTHVLLTSNADNGYDNVGLLEVATKKISLAHTRQMGNPRPRILARRQAHHLQRQRRRQRRYLSA